jgi:tetratricopeptide (TPR) repeat protein
MKTAPRSSVKRPRTLAGTVPASSDGARTRALAQYEAALRLMQESKFDKACAAFKQLLASSPADLTERIRMYINACTQQASRSETRFNSGEERYDYAISLLNQGNYEDARQHFQAILLEEQSADYAFYGLALLASMTGDADGCIEHLSEAIRLNGQNRLQARLDSDFDGVADDPRFTELLYPEA